MDVEKPLNQLQDAGFISTKHEFSSCKLGVGQNIAGQGVIPKILSFKPLRNCTLVFWLLDLLSGANAPYERIFVQ